MESSKARDSLTSRYLAALVAPAIIAGVMQVSWPFFEHNPVLPYLLAVIFCAWYGGLGPGLLSTVISILLTGFLFLEPYFFFWFPKQVNLVRLLLLAVVGSFISAISELMHRARRHAEINLESAERAQGSLREKERFANQIAELSPVVINVFDLATRRDVYISPDVVNLLGYTPKEIAEMEDPFSVLWHPEDITRANENLERIAQARDGEIIEFEYRILRRDGEWRWVASRIMPFERDHHGVVRQIITTSLDITERRHAEEALRASETFRRTIIESEPECVKLVGADCTLLDMNPAGLAMIGAKSREQVIGKSVLSLIAPEWRDRFVEMHERVCQGESVVGEFEIIGLNGVRRWMETHAAPLRTLDSGDITQLAIARDVTQRKRAEESLKLFRNLIDQSSDAIEVLEPSTLRFLDCNATAHQTLGYTREEFLSLSVFDIDPLVDERMTARLTNEVDSSGSLMFESIHRRKDGSTFPVEVNLKTVRLERDYRLAVVRETTERKVAEEALRQAERKYRDIFENAGEGIFQSTPDGRLIAANPALARLYGFASPEDLILNGQNISRQLYVDPTRRDEFKRQLEEQDSVRGFENQVFRKDGSRIWVSANAHAVRDAQGGIQYYEGTVQDITDRNLAEEALRESEERYRDLVENSLDLICTHDLDGLILSANRAAMELMGYSSGSYAGGTNFREILAPEVRDQFDDYLKRIRADGVASGLMLVQTRTGEKRIWEYHNTLRTQGVSAPIVRGMARDITEQRQANHSLRLFRTLIDRSSDAIEVIDPNTLRFLDCNESAYHDLGYTREEFLSLSVYDIDPLLDERMAAWLTEEMERSGFVTFESLHRRKDGSTFPVELNVKIVRLERDYRLAVVRDITDRKLAQEALHKAEKKYRDIFENAVEGIFQTTRDGRFITANPALARMFGFDSPEELIKERTDIPRQEYVEPQRREELKGLLEGYGVVRGFEYQAYRKDGSKIWILAQVRAVRDERGSVLYYEGTSEDITERKRAETRSAAFANLAQKLSGAMTPLDAGQIIAQTAQDLFGWDSCTLDLYDAEHDVIHPMLNVDTIGSKQVDVTPFFSAKPTPRGRRAMVHGPELILRKEPFRFDKDAVPFGDMSRPSAAIMTAPIRHASRVIGILSIQSYSPLVYDAVAMNDLQALADHCGEAMNRIQAEEQLRESEERYRDLVENSRELICTHDLDGLILSANRAATDVLGHDRKDYFGKKNLREILAPEVLEGFEDYLDRIRNDGVASGIMRVQTSSGEQRIWEYYNTLRTEGVAAPIVRGMARDITDRRRAEEALRAGEERYRELFENAKDAIYVQDLNGRYISVNRAAERLSGYTRDEIVGKHFEQFVAPEYLPLVCAKFSKKLADQEQTAYEIEVIAKDGRRVPVELSSALILKNGVPVGIQGIARDVTERKRAEDDLRQQKEILQKIFDHIPVMIRLAGPDGVVQLVNREYERTTGWSLEEIQQNNLDIFAELYPDKHERQVILNHIATAKGEWADFRTRVRDGRVIDTSWTNIHLSAGMTLGIGQDISERKRAEQTLRSYSRQLVEAQEAERQHIARELHDQIGQVLTAIRINLQTIGKSCETAESRPLIDQGVALIDAALEQVRSLSFELRPSLLDNLGLVAALRWYSDQYTQRTGIRTRSVTDPPGGQIRLRQELETACFRIVQEALTNVVRHADAKNVSIDLKTLDHKIVLSIKDDGIGFDVLSPNGGASAIRLGLRGMKERALALGGTLEIKSAPAQGTEIRACFPSESNGD